MATTILGVGGYGASGQSGEVLKTFALGSCVAVLAYDPGAKVAGMVHIALPSSATNKNRADVLPGYFADRGVPALLEAMARLRGTSDARGLVIKIAGGANVMRTGNVFDIGQRNIKAVKTELRQHGLAPVAAEVGGSISRTVSIEVDTGTVILNSPGRDAWSL